MYGTQCFSPPSFPLPPSVFLPPSFPLPPSFSLPPSLSLPPSSSLPPQAIALAKVLDGDDTTTQDEVSKRLAGFYRLKYGTSQPTLFRQDSEMQRIKQRATLHRSLENLLDTKPREKKKKRHQRHFSEWRHPSASKHSV